MDFLGRGRILIGVRLFLFGVLSFSALATEPVTTEGRTNRNAFLIARYSEKFATTPKGTEAELRLRINQALAPVRLAPTAWFRVSFGSVMTAPDRRKILESYSETEIWTCLGISCSGCPGNEALGCVLGKSTAGGIGVVALIHPCLYGDGKCPKDIFPADVSTWVEHIVSGIAYTKMGLKKDLTLVKKSQAASSAWIANTSRSVNLMLGACPGPYSTTSLRFLYDLEAVSLPNPALLRCGQTYVDTLRNLPTKCKLLKSALKDEWAGFEKKMLRPGSDILRCDGYCLKMLCRGKDAGTVFTQFSGKPALLLGDGACDGESTKQIGKFLHDALPREVRGKLDESGCLPAPEKAPTVNTTDDSMGSLGNGPEVQLVE